MSSTQSAASYRVSPRSTLRPFATAHEDDRPPCQGGSCGSSMPAFAFRGVLHASVGPSSIPGFLQDEPVASWRIDSRTVFLHQLWKEQEAYTFVIDVDYQPNDNEEVEPSPAEHEPANDRCVCCHGQRETSKGQDLRETQDRKHQFYHEVDETPSVSWDVFERLVVVQDECDGGDPEGEGEEHPAQGDEEADRCQREGSTVVLRQWRRIV